MTKDEIIDQMIDEMPFNLSENIRPYVKEAMDIYAQQEVKNCNILAVSKRSELLFAFIKEWKEEFKDENWDYLDFVAERVLSKQQLLTASGMAGVIAVNVASNVRPKLTAKEEAFFIAGFQECVKYLRGQVKGNGA